MNKGVPSYNSKLGALTLCGQGESIIVRLKGVTKDKATKPAVVLEILMSEDYLRVISSMKRLLAYLSSFDGLCHYLFGCLIYVPQSYLPCGIRL